MERRPSGVFGLIQQRFSCVLMDTDVQVVARKLCSYRLQSLTVVSFLEKEEKDY